jgi:hypothetical protein
MSHDEREKMRADLKKAGQWLKIARANKADVSKMIACYSNTDDRAHDCMMFGAASEPAEISLRLVSQDSGQYVRIKVGIVDWNNRFIKSEVYLDAAGVAALADRLRQAETFFTKAHAQSDKANLFK